MAHINKLTSVILTTSLLMAGCDRSQPEKTDMQIKLDLTDPRTFPSSAEVEKVVSKIEYGTVTVSAVTDQSMNYDSTVIRDEIPSYWMRSEKREKEKTKRFIQDVKTAYSSFTNARQGYSQSYFFASTSSKLQELSRSDADKKVMILVSDCFENSDAVSFYRYTKKPEQLLNDYDRIIGSLEAVYEMQGLDLTGVKIIVVYLPSKADDKLYLYTRRFWEKYWNEKNAEVEFVTQLKH